MLLARAEVSRRITGLVTAIALFVCASGAEAATYTVTLEGTYDGHDASGTYNAGTVWKQENGKWLAIFHTNIKQAGMTGDSQKKE